MSQLADKVAVIVGGATGIGAATAARFAAGGARVTIGDVNAEVGERTAASLRDAGHDVDFHQLDVSVPDQVQDLMSATAGRHGRIDVLFNNAAALGPEVFGRDDTVVDVDLDIWDRTLAVNLTGVMLGCRFALPYMMDAGRGAIVNTSSVDALRGQKGRHAYAVSKAGINILTMYMAADYASHGIRVNAIAPGLVMSPVARRNLSPEYLEVSSRHRLIQDPAEPEQIAPLVEFLCSDDASFITGQVVVIDGGNILQQADFAREIEEFKELQELRRQASGRVE